MENKINQEFSIFNIYKVLIKKWKFILSTIFIFSFFIFILSFIIPEEYSVSTTLIPPDENDSKGSASSLLQNMSIGISMGAGVPMSKVLLYIEFLKSKELYKFIINKYNLKQNNEFKKLSEDELCDFLISLISITSNRSGLIIIDAKYSTSWFPNDSEKKNAAKFITEIANATYEGLDFLNRNKLVSKAKRKMKFIEKVLVDKHQILDSIDLKLENFRKVNKILEISEQTKALISNTSNIGTELAKTEMDLSLIEQDYLPNTPIVQNYKKKYSELMYQFKRSQEGGLGSNDIVSLNLKNVPELIKVYSNLLRDQKILEQVIIYLETQKYQEAVQAESDIPTVEPLDKATIPNKRSSPSKKFMLLLAIVVSGLLSSIYVILSAVKKGNLIVKKEA